MLGMSTGLTILTIAVCVGLPLMMLVTNVIGMIVQAHSHRTTDVTQLRAKVAELEDWIAHQ